MLEIWQLTWKAMIKTLISHLQGGTNEITASRCWCSKDKNKSKMQDNFVTIEDKGYEKEIKGIQGKCDTVNPIKS